MSSPSADLLAEVLGVPLELVAQLGGAAQQLEDLDARLRRCGRRQAVAEQVGARLLAAHLDQLGLRPLTQPPEAPPSALPRWW
jgi:hypothetical protein